MKKPEYKTTRLMLAMIFFALMASTCHAGPPLVVQNVVDGLNHTSLNLPTGFMYFQAEPNAGIYRASSDLAQTGTFGILNVGNTAISNVRLEFSPLRSSDGDLLTDSSGARISPPIPSSPPPYTINSGATTTVTINWAGTTVNSTAPSGLYQCTATVAYDSPLGGGTIPCDSFVIRIAVHPLSLLRNYSPPSGAETNAVGILPMRPWQLATFRGTGGGGTYVHGEAIDTTCYPPSQLECYIPSGTTIGNGSLSLTITCKKLDGNTDTRSVVIPNGTRGGSAIDVGATTDVYWDVTAVSCTGGINGDRVIIRNKQYSNKQISLTGGNVNDSANALQTQYGYFGLENCGLVPLGTDSTHQIVYLLSDLWDGVSGHAVIPKANITAYSTSNFRPLNSSKLAGNTSSDNAKFYVTIPGSQPAGIYIGTIMVYADLSGNAAPNTHSVTTVVPSSGEPYDTFQLRVIVDNTSYPVVAMGSYAVTGSGAGTFTNGSTIDLTAYSRCQLECYIPTGTTIGNGNLVLTVTCKRKTDATTETRTVTITNGATAGTTFDLGATSDTYWDVTNITCTGGIAGDKVSIRTKNPLKIGLTSTTPAWGASQIVTVTHDFNIPILMGVFNAGGGGTGLFTDGSAINTDKCAPTQLECHIPIGTTIGNGGLSLNVTCRRLDGVSEIRTVAIPNGTVGDTVIDIGTSSNVYWDVTNVTCIGGVNGDAVQIRSKGDQITLDVYDPFGANRYHVGPYTFQSTDSNPYSFAAFNIPTDREIYGLWTTRVTLNLAGGLTPVYNISNFNVQSPVSFSAGALTLTQSTNPQWYTGTVSVTNNSTSAVYFDTVGASLYRSGTTVYDFTSSIDSSNIVVAPLTIPAGTVNAAVSISVYVPPNTPPGTYCTANDTGSNLTAPVRSAFRAFQERNGDTRFQYYTSDMDPCTNNGPEVDDLLQLQVIVGSTPRVEVDAQLMDVGKFTDDGLQHRSVALLTLRNTGNETLTALHAALLEMNSLSDPQHTVVPPLYLMTQLGSFTVTTPGNGAFSSGDVIDITQFPASQLECYVPTGTTIGNGNLSLTITCRTSGGTTQTRPVAISNGSAQGTTYDVGASTDLYVAVTNVACTGGVAGDTVRIRNKPYLIERDSASVAADPFSTSPNNANILPGGYAKYLLTVTIPVGQPSNTYAGYLAQGTATYPSNVTTTGGNVGLPSITVLATVAEMNLGTNVNSTNAASPNTGGETSPAVTSNSGNFYLYWSSNRSTAGNTWNIYRSTSANGNTWSAAANITSDAADNMKNSRPATIVDPNNNVWVFWESKSPPVAPTTPVPFRSQILYKRGASSTRQLVGWGWNELATSTTSPQPDMVKEDPAVTSLTVGGSTYFWAVWQGMSSSQSPYQLFANYHLYNNSNTPVWSPNPDAPNNRVGFSPPSDLPLSTMTGASVTTSGRYYVTLPHSPPALIWMKEPQVFGATYTDAASTQRACLSLFYTGYSKFRQQEDIYWTRFDPGYDAGNTSNSGGLNYQYFDRTKNTCQIPFPRITGETMVTDADRRIFTAQHGDWAYETIASNSTITPGTYTPDVFVNGVQFNPSAHRLDPSSGNLAYPATGTPTLYLDPAAGTVTFVTARAAGDVVTVNYTPLTRRITTGLTHNSIPTVVFEPTSPNGAAVGRIWIFFRKRLPMEQTGAIYYKTYRSGVRVASASIDTSHNVTVTNGTLISSTANRVDRLEAGRGIVYLTYPGDLGKTNINVTYYPAGAAASTTNNNLTVDWQLEQDETPVRMDSPLSEGAIAVWIDTAASRRRVWLYWSAMTGRPIANMATPTTDWDLYSQVICPYVLP